MKENRLSTNIFFNILNQLVTLIVPLILSPYVARVLSAELIGDYSYALANSSYFVLIESLGLPLYGMLTVSAKRNDKVYLSTLFKEIMIAKIILMLLCVSIYTVAFVVFGNTNRILCFIMIFNIISTGIDSTWFLMGMEDFKTTAFRNIGVRIANVLLTLLFVKSKDDFLAYAVIMQGANVISFIVVLPQVRKYLVPSKIGYMNIIVHIKKSLAYFVPGIINTIFTSADKTVLGAFANNYEVGVYEQASKISTLCGSVINSVSNVVLPRVTYLNNNASKEESRNFLFKTLRFSSVFSIAISVGIVSIADDFVPVFLGTGYEKSAVLLKILSINVLMSVLANYIGQQCLISNNRQHDYNIAIGTSAIINVLINILLVNNFKSVGVSLASVISAIVTLMMILHYSKDIINYMDIAKMIWKSAVAAIVMFVIDYQIVVASTLLSLLLKISIGVLTFILILYFLKDDIIQELSIEIKRKMK